jgi:small subunit ribosomal protein S13
MARIEGVDLPRNKRVDIALTYLYGIGRSNVVNLLEKAGVDGSVRTQDLTDADIGRIRDVLQREYRVEGELRKEVAMNIKRLIDLGTYRGSRHKRGLPVHGQRTHTNARTRKGPRRAVAAKKK